MGGKCMFTEKERLERALRQEEVDRPHVSVLGE